QNWGAFLRGSVASTQGGTPAGAGRQKSKGKWQKSKIRKYCSPTPDSRSPIRSRSVLSQSYRHCPKAAGEIVGVTGGDELEPTVATTGQAARCSPAVI